MPPIVALDVYQQVGQNQHNNAARGRVFEREKKKRHRDTRRRREKERDDR